MHVLCAHCYDGAIGQDWPMESVENPGLPEKVYWEWWQKTVGLRRLPDFTPPLRIRVSQSCVISEFLDRLEH